MEDLFYQVVLLLRDIEEINFEHLFVDGTKIEANANKYTFVWKKVIRKNEEKMLTKIVELFNQINANYLVNIALDPKNVARSLSTALSFLKTKQSDEGISFVHGIGKRKTLLQKLTEQTQVFLDRQEKYESCNALFKGRNSYSRTDPDATFMHMKDDHMRNAQLKPGYNVQIGVESEYIIGMAIYADRSDVATLIPFLENLHNHLQIRSKNIIADAGYESEENYLYLETNHQNPYIKPSMYEKWKKKSFKKDISKRENMCYMEEGDYYICAANKQLTMQGISHRTSANGYVSEVTTYACEDCTGCGYKEKCTKAKGNKKLQVSKKFVEKRAISYENIKTDEGIQLRMNRSIQVEGAFGVLKWDHDFTRFLRRGKNNVKTEFMILCFAYNIRKLHSKIQNERCEKHLHPLKTA